MSRIRAGARVGGQTLLGVLGAVFGLVLFIVFVIVMLNLLGLLLSWAAEGTGSGATGVAIRIVVGIAILFVGSGFAVVAASIVTGLVNGTAFGLAAAASWLLESREPHPRLASVGTVGATLGKALFGVFFGLTLLWYAFVFPKAAPLGEWSVLLMAVALFLLWMPSTALVGFAIVRQNDDLQHPPLTRFDLDQREIEILKLEVSDRSKSTLTAWLLFVILGGLGAHRFYLGRKRSGTTMLAVNLVLGVWLTWPIVVWWLIDLFLMQGMIRRQRLDAERLVLAEICRKREAYKLSYDDVPSL